MFKAVVLARTMIDVELSAFLVRRAQRLPNRAAVARPEAGGRMPLSLPTTRRSLAMPCWKCLVAGLALCVVVGMSPLRASAAEEAKAAAGKQAPQKFERTIKIELEYLLYLPKDYDQKESWPLLLFLHGAGERGEDLNKVKFHGPPKLIAAGKEFPFIVVSPQCPTRSRGWQPFELSALLDDLTQKYKVDKDRLYVTGLSMGGFGTWALAAYSPDRFAALVPICGGGDPNTARRFAHVPIWVFHGAKDPTVPLSASERMVEALKKAGVTPKFTVYPDAGHDSWTEAYNNPELYEWLLQQKRTPRKPEGGKR
jgi:predicted peptidase